MPGSSTRLGPARRASGLEPGSGVRLQRLLATVAERACETADAVTLKLDVPGWPGHRAGQHVVVRLTAEDGYSTGRSYSIASPPGAELVELTIVRLEGGEVSSHLADLVIPGDRLELEGPIGGYFVWDPDVDRSVLLLGGGSGVVPLMAMLRHHRALHHQAPMDLIYSARTDASILYRDELASTDGEHRSVTVTVSRQPSPTWQGRHGRIGPDLLRAVGGPPSRRPQCFVCGPNGFVDAASDALVEIGHDVADIRTERFGSTG